MRPDVLVVGGGCAGLAAATALAERGASVRVLEARPTAGGRSRSWVHPETGDVEDNGQHIVMGCYDDFLQFVRRTGGIESLVFQDRLEIVLLEPGGKECAFRPGSLPRPFDLLWGLARLRGFSAADALRARRIIGEIQAPGETDLANTTVAGWIGRHGQSPGARRTFWDPLTLATLNLSPETASASLLAEVLRRALLGGPDAARIGFPRDGLGALVVDPSLAYLRERGGEALGRQTVAKLEIDHGGRFAAARTRNGTRHEGGAAVLAVPPAQAARLLPPAASEFDVAAADGLGSAAIVAVHLWFDREVAGRAMTGLLDSPIHWVFDRGRIGGSAAPGYLALVTSAARPLADSPKEVLIRTALEEVRRFFPASRRATLLRSRVLKERRATPVFGPGTACLRPGPRTSVPNLVLAGDWTSTGLPATLESAAASGHRAAALLD